MKSYLIFIITLIVFLVIPFSVFAAEKNQTIFLPKDQIINHDYFATGNGVDIDGTVNGDVYAAGGTVLINGTVHGDVIAGGGTVTIRGDVQNIRVGGGQIIIDGRVHGNVTVLGGNITVTSTALLEGSLVGAGGQVSILGPVTKTVSLAAGQATLGNVVGSDVWISGQQILLTPEGKINGNLSYVSSQKAQIENGASISGKVIQTYPPQPEKNKQHTPSSRIIAALVGFKIAFSIVSFLISLVVGLLLLSLTPLYVGRVIEHIARHTWQSFLIGLVTWIILPFLVILLIITIIGIPFAVVVLFSVGILSYIGKIIVAVIIGSWAIQTFDKRKNMTIALIVGLIIVEVLGLIPVLGWLVGFIISAVGLGSMVYMKKMYYTELRTKKII